MRSGPTKPEKEKMATQKTTSNDWRLDQQNGYVASYNADTQEFSGPADAFVWFGLPWEGDPNRTSYVNQFTGKEEACQSYVDQTRLSTELNGVVVKWVVWDQATGCNIYRRTA